MKTIQLLRLSLIIGGALSCSLHGATMTYTVTNTSGDLVPGSLRQAIADSNLNNPAPDPRNTIEFNIPGAGPHVIVLNTFASDGSGMRITQPVEINGYSQPGAIPNTATDGTTNAVLKIAIEGGGVANPDVNNCFFVTTPAVPNIILRGLAIGNFIGGSLSNNPASSKNGIACLFRFAPDCQIVGCFIGTDVTGTQSRPCVMPLQMVACDRLIIGDVTGTNPANINILATSGSFFGSVLSNYFSAGGPNAPKISGNLVGVDPTGTFAIGDSFTGIFLSGSDHQAKNNVISGQAGPAVFILRDRNILENNYIGSDVTGTQVIGNGQGLFISCSTSSADNQIINNLFVASTDDAVHVGSNGEDSPDVDRPVFRGNIFGLDITGTKVKDASGKSFANKRHNIWLQHTVGAVIGGVNVADRNIIATAEKDGLRLSAATDAVIINNIIGLDITGTQFEDADGNSYGNGEDGVRIFGTSLNTNNRIGGTPEERNIISNNGGNGVEIVTFATDTVVQNNYIGSSITGDQIARPNPEQYGNGQNGVLVKCSSSTTIVDNLIEYNGGHGVELGTGANQNTVQHNNIHDNGDDGVAIVDASCNLIGGLEVLACSVLCDVKNGNVIANNDGYGVSVTQQCGMAVDNAILSNEFFGNEKGDIVLRTEPCAQPCGAAVLSCGPNHNQAAPCLKSVRRRGCEVEVRGSLKSAPETDYIIQFYAVGKDAQCTDSIFLGQQVIRTNRAGKACFNVRVPYNCACAHTPGCEPSCACLERCTSVVATATRLRDDQPTDTSAFKKRVRMSGCCKK